MLSLRLLACALIAAFVLVSAPQSADAAGQSCGAFVGPGVCGKREFCELPAGACVFVPGRCVARPQFCNRMYRPVCGCDGKTYGNDCERRAAGVSKYANGKC